MELLSRAMQSPSRFTTRVAIILLPILLMSAFLLSSGGTVHAASGPSLLPSTTLVSKPPTGNKGPDDICILASQALDGGKALIWTAYQNGIQANGTAGTPGSPTQSTIAGYDPTTGALVTTISVTGKSDGLGCDTATGKLISTLNEDSHSSIDVIDPSTGTVTTYTFSPSVEVSGNGGTDSIAFQNGHIYVTHSNPNDSSQPLAYDVTFDDSTHTANVTPVLSCNSTATDVVTGSTVTLAVTDPDTNFIMPDASPRFGGTLATIGQADGQLIFATMGSGSSQVSVLNLTDQFHSMDVSRGVTAPFDGLAVATADSGTLYVIDAKASQIFALDTTGWPAGTVFIGEPSDVGNPIVGTLDLSTGKVTPLVNAFQSPKGLLFVPNTPQSATQAVTSAATPTQTNTSSSSSGMDGVLYGAVAVIVVIVVALAYVATRKKKSSKPA